MASADAEVERISCPFTGVALPGCALHGGRDRHHLFGAVQRPDAGRRRLSRPPFPVGSVDTLKALGAGRGSCAVV